MRKLVIDPIVSAIAMFDTIERSPQSSPVLLKSCDNFGVELRKNVCTLIHVLNERLQQ